MTYWIDAEDLVQFADRYERPTGIQRLCYEVCSVLARWDDVRFCRHAPINYELVPVAWREIKEAFDRLTSDSLVPPTSYKQEDDSASQFPGVPLTLRRALDRLPPEARAHLSTAARAQKTALSAAASLFSILWRESQKKIIDQSTLVLSRDLYAQLQPGDVLLALGASWTRAHYGTMIASLKRRYRIKFGTLLYDFIPIVRPEYVSASRKKSFASWCQGALPHCDLVMTISRATAADATRLRTSVGIGPDVPIVPIPIGTSFSDLRVDSPTAQLPSEVAKANRYALFVSTIEPRKNHILAFRIWRRLLEELPREQVPALVFAGRIGWMVDDLLKQISNTGWLDGHLIFLDRPCDAVLETLYRNCAFSLFPSFYEGWGLPVSESLGFGRPCLASNSTAIPEAGGDFCTYFDPDNGPAAYNLVRKVIENPALLGAMAGRIEREYVPIPWSVTAEKIIDCVRLHITRSENLA